MARLIVPLLTLLLVLTMLLSMGIGSVNIDPISGISEWLRGIDSRDAIITGEIRLPRTLLAVIVGASLGLSGAALQGLLRNPLADPGLIGASQGAALGASSVFYFGLFASAGTLATPIAGLLGAGITLMMILALAGSGRPSLVILAGLAISTLTGAALATVLNFAPNPYAMQELVFWLLGSVSERGLENLRFLLPALLIGSLLILRQRPLLAALSLGEQIAESMGLAVQRGSRAIILGTALLVGASVAVAGNIGFVGLVVPHLIRPMVKHRPDRLLIPSALAGGILVMLADMAVRLLPPGRELKLGVLTSLLGAPLFIWLIWKDRKRWL